MYDWFNEGNAVLTFLLIILLALLVLPFYFAPFIIALNRNHHYKWVIFVLNLIGFVAGVPWVVAFVWAVWPQQTWLISPILNDPTSNNPLSGQKNYNDAGKNIATFTEASKSWEDKLLKLHQLKEKKVISEEEFETEKSKILKSRI